MINKIISNLPFNPSIIDDAAFYAKRLKQEEPIRRLGIVMIVLSMLIQIFAATLPPEKSLAYSENHILNGANTRNDLLKAWDNPRSDFSAIQKKMGVTRSDIANLSFRPNDSIRSDSKNYWSIGRNSLSGYSDIKQNHKKNEIALRAEGTTFFMRQLRAWDTRAPSSTYDAFRGRNSTTGETFWIIADCGNYTQIGRSTPKDPKLQIRKTVANNKRNIKAGDTVKYRIEYRNRAPDSLAENVRLVDNLNSDRFNVVGPKRFMTNGNKRFVNNLGSMRFTENSRVAYIRIKVKSNLKDGTVICNTAILRSSNAKNVRSRDCFRVNNPQTTERDDKPTEDEPTPEPEQERNVEPEPTPEPEPEPEPEPTPEPEEIPPGQTKTVKNITRDLSGEKAIDTTVRSGDVIEYSLQTSNSREAPIENYRVSDYVGDILDYANLDREYLEAQGGTFDERTNEVVWANQTLPANSDEIHKFRVVMKDPLPSTNSPSGVSTDFDCIISNEYGEEISLNVACPAIKTVEELPNTGPGEAVGVAVVITMISGYFFARNRLLAKEIAIVRKNYASGSGA